MRIGIINMPGRYSFGDQSIQTRFFMLGLPLFPTGCLYKVSNNLGIDIPLTRKDILHAYAKIHFGILGIAGFLGGANLMEEDTSIKIVVFVLSLLLIGFCIYSWMAHSQVKGDEVLKRKIFGKAFLYNMPPEYLPLDVQKSLFGELIKTYIGKFKNLNWQESIKSGDVTKSNFSILYTLAYYLKTLESTPEHNALFEEIASYLKKGKKVKPEPVENNQTVPLVAKENLNAQKIKIVTNPEFENAGIVSNPKQEVKSFDYKTDQPQSVDVAQKAAYAQAPPATEKSNTAKIEMTPGDVLKLHNAKESLMNQLLMFSGLFALGVIVVTLLSSDISNLIYVLLLCLIICGAISAIVFLPDYSKIQNDLKYRQKMRVKVRVKDLEKESGSAYLVLKANRYNIQKITAEPKYYSTNLLNKELDIYVAKESHVLLEVIGVNY